MQFSDLLLLGKGGKTVYMGPVVDALPYFERALSITCPPRINPAGEGLRCRASTWQPCVAARIFSALGVCVLVPACRLHARLRRR